MNKNQSGKNNSRYKHGHLVNKKQSSTYTAWRNMKSRCFNTNNSYYHLYGGRNIGVCDRWLESFEFFLQDMGEKPIGMQLDRVDNDLGYWPENCRWVTPHEQGCNRRPYGFSRFRGVSYHKPTKKWMAQIMLNGKRKHLGLFQSEIKAAKAWNDYIVKNKLNRILNKFYRKKRKGEL